MRQLIEVMPDGQERPVFFWPNLLHDLRTFGARTALYNAWCVVRFFVLGDDTLYDDKKEDRRSRGDAYS